MNKFVLTKTRRGRIIMRVRVTVSNAQFLQPQLLTGHDSALDLCSEVSDWNILV